MFYSILWWHLAGAGRVLSQDAVFAGATALASPENAPALANWLISVLGRGEYLTRGLETVQGGERRHAFDIAMDLALENPIDGVVGATYPLSRWREALDHALGAGKLGTLKVAFDPRAEAI